MIPEKSDFFDWTPRPQPKRPPRTHCPNHPARRIKKGKRVCHECNAAREAEYARNHRNPKYDSDDNNDPYRNTTGLKPGEMTSCPWCHDPMIRRDMWEHRRSGLCPSKPRF